MIGLAATAAILAAAPARAQDLQFYDIPAQPLDQALIAFAADAGISLALPEEGMSDRRAPSLVGVMGVEDALIRLLADSGFSAERSGDRAWRVSPAPPPPPPAPGPAPAPPPAVAAAPDVPPFDRVLVVARQPAALRNMTRSASQVDAARLNQLGAHSLSDLVSEVGSVQFTNVGRGRNKVLVRGVSDGAIAGQAQSTTAIYFGDMRLTYAGPDPDLQLADVRSVEVLRGPQGALYGAGAIGGILRIEPNPPDLDDPSAVVFGSTEAGSEGAEGYNLELAANAPVAPGRLALRGVYYAQQFTGWLETPALGIDNVNQTRRTGQRLTALARLTDDLELELGGLRQTVAARDSQYWIVQPGGGLTRPGVVEPSDTNFLEVHGTLRWTTPVADISSTTGIVRHDIRSRYDVTGLFGGLGVDTSQKRPLDQEERLRIFMHETRVLSPAGAPTPWFFGVFVSSGRNDRDLALRVGPASDFPDTAYEDDRNGHVTELGLFGEATWTLAPGLSLSTGGRLLRYTTHIDASAAAQGAAPADTFAGRVEKLGFAPDLRLAWRPADTLLIHVSAAKGFRGPGFNTGGGGTVSFNGANQPFRVYRGDVLWTHELGASWIAPDGAASVSVTAFRNHWRQIQTDELSSGDFLFTGNAGDSDGYGVEASGWWRIAPALTLRSNVLVSEPELTGPDPTFPGMLDSALPSTPELSGGASIHYTRDVHAFGHALTVNAELSGAYTGKSRLAFGAGGEIGNYSVAGFRLAVSDGDWEAAVYGHNVLDARGDTFSNGNPYQSARRVMVTPLRPAVYGVSLRRAF